LLCSALKSARGYVPETGRLKTIVTNRVIPATPNVQHLEYSFDTLGNLTRREDLLGERRELFGYDMQGGGFKNRLTSTALYDTAPATPVLLESASFGYDKLGNLTSKPVNGNLNYYTYGAGTAGPHAVTTAGGKTLTYDLNGNLLSGWNFATGNPRSIEWTSYNKPNEIAESGTTLEFSYGAGRDRFKQENTSGGVLTTTYYIGNLYEKVTSGSGAGTLIRHVHYIYAGSERVAIYEVPAGGEPLVVGTPTVRYLLTDHLGSVTEVMSAGGGLLESLSYDAWGKRRPKEWDAEGSPPEFPFQTTRGFTGHEMLDQVSLIHMNGRVYDPDLGRFLSADPNVQEPLNSQNLNRYSYVLNNPLSYTDPSGYFFGKIFNAIGKVFDFVFDNIRTIAAIAVAVIVAPYCVPCAGFASGMISSGGDLKAGIIGAFTATAFQGIGSYFDSVSFAGEALARTVAHGVVGGLSSVVQGGDFVSGFVSAGATQAFALSGGFEALGGDAPGTTDFGGIDYVHNMVVAAVVGGTAAVMGGGKFKNGALTGAFSRLFNDLSESDIWNRKALSREIEINRITGTSDVELVSATDWETRLINDGVDNSFAKLGKRLLGRVLTVSYEQSRTATYGQFDEVEVYRYRTVYDLVDGRITNEQILFETETFIRQERILIESTSRQVYETRACFFGICSQ